MRNDLVEVFARVRVNLRLLKGNIAGKRAALRTNLENFKLQSGFRCLILTVSGRVYIGNMRRNQGNQVNNAPVFIEVPKPVTDMSKDELDSFVEEILIALEEKR